MSWRTNDLVVAARNFGRSLGVNNLIAGLVNGSGYETRYDNSFSSQLRSGDCVWDVGANVGYYSRLFSERAGNNGVVFAFEPSPVNHARLTKDCIDFSNIRIYQLGLGNENGTLSFQQSNDDLGANSRVIEGALEGSVLVNIRSGMELIKNDGILPPNIIKIDVEGFEHEVVLGLEEYLSSPALRAIGIEVHFGILKERGMGQAPKKIERLLQKHGFSVSWPDSSHILAARS